MCALSYGIETYQGLQMGQFTESMEYAHYQIGSFLTFISRPIMSSPYNKGVWLLSVLKLWPIVKTSVMSENDGITVRQTVAHPIQLWPHRLGTPCSSRLVRRKAQ